MIPRFPAVTAREVIRVAEQLGFRLLRETGSSHAVYKRESDGRRTVIPRHSRTVLKRRTLNSILKDLGISVGEFREML
jgi:predicted RNA binding protein YcfA (HicA-like mRNA interferase family)